MNKSILLLIVLIPWVANAKPSNYEQQKQQILAQLDYCSNIASQEIFNLGTLDLIAIRKDIEAIRSAFKKYTNDKTVCFDNAKIMLEEILAESAIFLQKNDDISFQQQYKIDLDLIDYINLRKKVSIDLLSGILKDIESSISVKTLQNKFIVESNQTKALVYQELAIIYNSMQDQLRLDQQKIDLKNKIKVKEVANITVRAAFLDLNRAMLLFENIQTEHKAYLLSQVKSYVQHSYNKLEELKLFSPSLENLDSKDSLNKVFNKLSILVVDLEVAIKDISSEKFNDDYLTWASQVYQQISEITALLQEVLDAVYLQSI